MLTNLARATPCPPTARMLMQEASDRWGAGHPTVDGDTRSLLEAHDAGLFSQEMFWRIANWERVQEEKERWMTTC